MTEMPVKIFNVAHPTGKRCDLCHRVSKNLYRVNIGGMFYNICSQAEVRAAVKNFQANKNIKFDEPTTEEPLISVDDV